MKYLAVSILLIFAAVAGAQSRPNIVFIMADDMGVAELGVTGQLDRAANGLPSIDTPNLDTLAVNGLRMNRFYATPICASTRSAVMTGFHNGHSSIDRNGGNNGGNAMRDVDVTMAEMLKSAGYTTAGYGKWGLGGYDHTATGGGVGNIATAAITHPLATPANQGFDEFYGYLNQVHAHDYYVDFLWEQDGNGGMRLDPVSRNDYSHDLMANRTLDFISRNADPTGDDPFFVYGAYTIPHNDFNPPNDAILQDYVSRGYSSAQANYAAMITRLDNTVGDIVDRLHDPNGDGDQSDSVFDNTLILFASDNGGTGNENNLFGGDGGLRGTKGSVHEGGTRSPFIASWNGTIAPGQVDDTNMAALEDLFASFAELAGAEVPVGMDSASFAGRFTGEPIERRASRVFEARNANDWAIVVDDWKLSKSGSNSFGLYHLPSDPDENNNRFGSSPAIASLLTQMALDEGVESDAGSGAAQTTHIVQYKNWMPQNGSDDWNAAANWSGGTATNTRGTTANNFNTGPASNWIATINNSEGGTRTASLSRDSTVLGMEILGSAGNMQVRVEAGVTLRAHNGVRVESLGRLTLDNANLETVRTVEVQHGAVLSGSGTISTGYDTTGTPFVLKSYVENDGRLEISPSDSGVSLIDVVQNGGFELGTGNPYSQTTAWSNLGGDNSRNARNTSNPAAGAYRGIVGISGDGTGTAISPFQATGHTIALGDEYLLEFEYAGASGWDEGSDEIEVAVYYTDGGNVIDLFNTTVNPSQNFGAGYDSFSTTLPAVTDPNSVGRELLIRFESSGGSGEFASIDELSLSLTQPTATLSRLTIDGDYDQFSDGVLAIDLIGEVGQAGVDFDQLVVTHDARLDGVLELAVAMGITLVEYSPMEIISAATVDGTFAMVDGAVQGSRGLAVTYEEDSVLVQLALLGDANLDGVVDISDFNIWNANKFTAGGTWESGDFNGDGVTDTSDFNIWNANKFTSLARTVPEPSACGLLLLGLLVVVMKKRSGRLAT
ncbi:MAG: sulfatase-like hydrolase/transferase [Planctomycetota bacterium]